MPSSSSSQPAPTGAAQRPPETDQNNGDLLQFSHQLLAAMPAGGGEMPMEDLLTALQSAAPQVFVALGHFQQLAQKVCGLNEEMAKKWKEKGNHEYKSGALNDSILSYSHGLLCAELDETMAALLNNRSTAYYEQHRYADACIDADRAQRYQPTYWKAIQRRGRCLEELNFRDLGQKDVQAAAAENREEANDDETMARVLGTAIAGKADTALPPRAVLSHSLKVERSAKGRGLVATERLEPGTMLDETPFAMVARAEALLSVCSYCLQHTTSLYHGEEFRRAGMKSRGFFCSEACATAAWTHYGEVESRNPFFLCCPNDALLAYRIVRGLTLFPQMAELNVCEGFDDVAQHDEVASQVKILEGSFSRELQPQAAVGGFESIMTAIALFMGAVTPAEAELMRKAQRQILLNAKEVTCILRAPSANSRSNDADYVHTNTTGVLGKGLYPIAALLNHSCDPNCFISFAGNPQGSSARLVVRSIRPIMEGEELTVSYGQVDRFHVHSLRQRMLTLRNQYGFPCRCEACRNEVDEPVLAAQKEHYIKAADYYQKGRRLIRERNYETAVTVLLQSYDMVYRYLCPPPNPPQPMVPKTHDALALAYFHLNQRDKCLEHLRAQLATDLEIHHNDNRCSLINDYTRLSYFSTDAAERAKYTEKAVVLLRRFYAPSELLEVYIAMIEHNASHVAE